MVEARKDVDKVEERYDLFSGLLDAAEDELGSEAALSDDELMGWYSLSDHAAFIEVVLPPPRKHVYLSSCWTRSRIVSFFLPCCPYTAPTDYSAYTMLLICLVGPVSRRTRASISTYKRGYVQLEWNACGSLKSRFL